MLSKTQERTKFLECERKKKFNSVKTAKASKRGMLFHSRTAVGLIVYECRWCGKFHLGHPEGYGKMVTTRVNQ